MNRLSKLLFLSTLVVLPAFAVVVTDPTNLEQHRQLAEELPYADVAGVGGGIPIHSRWILTAAHVAGGLDRGSDQVIVAGEPVRIKNVYLHPGFLHSATEIRNDIALIELDSDLAADSFPDITSGDYSEKSVVTLAGSGEFGVAGQAGFEKTRGLLAAQNRISALTDQWIKIKLDQGDLSLEGLGAIGDSGGPLLISNEKGGWDLIGVSSHDLSNGEYRVFGDADVYTRVNAYLDWITDVMAGKQQPFSRDHQPVSSEISELINQYLVAFNENFDAVRRFSGMHSSTAAKTRYPVEQRQVSYQSLKARWGQLQLQSITAEPTMENGYVAMLSSSKIADFQLMFLFVQEDGLKLDALATFE